MIQNDKSETRTKLLFKVCHEVNRMIDSKTGSLSQIEDIITLTDEEKELLGIKVKMTNKDKQAILLSKKLDLKKSILPSGVPNGTYPGVWSGYFVTFLDDDDISYSVRVEDGNRGFSPCEVVVGGAYGIRVNRVEK